jgi:hypothetical protein
MADSDFSPGMPRERKSDRWFALSMLILWIAASVNCFLQYSYTGIIKTQPYLVGIDQNCYFAYARSLLFDADLNFTNEYRFLAETQPASTAEVFQAMVKQSPHSPQNPFNLGTGLAALPALALARAFFSGMHLIGLSRAVSGFASIYPLLFLLTNITYGVLALACCYAFLRRWFSPAICAAAAWAVLLSGPMLYYLWGEPGMSHLTGAFFTSAGLLCWSYWSQATQLQRKCIFARLAGFCCIFAAVVRPYDLPAAVILVQPMAAYFFQRRNGLTSPPRTVLLPYCFAALGCMLAALPQLIAWRIQFGTWIANTTNYPLPWRSPYALHVLFSRRHGLFFWSPGLLLAIVALTLYIRHHRTPAAWLLAIFLAVTWMAGAWWYYWIGVSFGMRTYVDHPLPFAFGFAVIAGWLTQRLGPRALHVAWESIALLALINIHLILCFRGGIIYVDGPLYWLDSVSKGKLYKAQLQREVRYWTDFTPENRAHLLQAPPGYR